MNESSKLQQAAVELISKYFGQNTAKVYDKFFVDESDSAIVVSVNSILSDYIGKTKAEEEIKKMTEGLTL